MHFNVRGFISSGHKLPAQNRILNPRLDRISDWDDSGCDSSTLSKEQNRLLSILSLGKNCYFTGLIWLKGKAGTGKTAVLKIFMMRARQGKHRLGVTASTGFD